MTDPAHDLLAELGWLRTLARQLVRDPELADDLVQDACAVALAQSPPPRSWRAWLATILPNLLHGHRRREAARRRRETTNPGRGPADDASQLLQRAEAQQKLVGAVLALAEPYRATVLLRFFEGLPPRHIAARLRVPVATVHSRLQRALDQLRQTLDHDFAGRPNWLAAFAPFAWPTLAPTTVGVFVMQTKLKVLAAAAVLACSAPLWWPSAATSSEPELAATNATDARHRGGSSGGGGEATPATPRELVRHDATPPGSSPPPAPARQFSVSGRVCDCRGEALAGVPIGVDGKPEIAARSDSLGAFTFVQSADAAQLAAVGERFVTVLGGTWTSTATIPPVVVVADAVRIAGRVVDEAGAPIPASEVVLQLPADFDSRFPARSPSKARPCTAAAASSGSSSPPSLASPPSAASASSTQRARLGACVAHDTGASRPRREVLPSAHLMPSSKEPTTILYDLIVRAVVAYERDGEAALVRELAAAGDHAPRV